MLYYDSIIHQCFQCKKIIIRDITESKDKLKEEEESVMISKVIRLAYYCMQRF